MDVCFLSLLNYTSIQIIFSQAASYSLPDSIGTISAEDYMEYEEAKWWLETVERSF